MQAAIITEITKVERFKFVCYYNLKYKLNGEVKHVEWFSENNNLMVGDIIYI